MSLIVAKHRGIWPAEWLCGALGVSRGGFYAWLRRPRSRRSRRDEELGAKVRSSFLASDRTYGARRVWHDMLAEGVSCDLHRIERLMRLQALKARPRRRRLPPDLGGAAGRFRQNPRIEGRYDDTRIAKVSAAIQAALMNTLRVPPEDFYQLIFEFPKKRFLHTPSFVGMHYTDDLIILDLTFIEGRSKETRLALLKDVNTRVAAAAGVSPDDMLITLYEAPGENFSFGQGEAQRANAVPREQKSPS